MVLNSQTVVLERNETFDAAFETEPYEAGWASEARWFINVLEGAGTLEVNTQVSPDGLHWCDDGSPGVSIAEPGLHSFAGREFGAWVRLRVDMERPGPFKLHIHLQLKG